MDSRHGSSSRAPSPQLGDSRRCSVPHSELVMLQAEGYLPPAFMVPSSWTGHLQGREAGGERPQSLQRRAGMLLPLLNKGTRISHTSVSPGAPGVLRTPTSPPHTYLHFAHRGLCSCLRAVLGHRAPFCIVEENILPRTPFSQGVDISSGRSRNMAHRRDRISMQKSEEGVRRLAFGVVLYGRRTAAGSSSDQPPRV